MRRSKQAEEEVASRAIELDEARGEGGNGSREEGKKRGGSPEVDEGGDRRSLPRERERERERRGEETSPGPKAAEEPLKKTA